MQELRLRQQQLNSNKALEEERRQKIAKEAQAEQDQQKFYAIIAASKTPDEAQARIQTEVPALYQPFLKQRSELDEKAAAINQKVVEAKKAQAEIAIKGQEYAGPLMQLVEKSGYQPGVMEFALSAAQQHFPEFPADQYRQQVAQGGPSAIKQIVDSLKSPQQQNADTTAQTANAELPEKVAKGALAGKVNAGASPTGITADQQAQLAQGAQRVGLEQQRVGLERQRVANETMNADAAPTLEQAA